jgi:peptidoglycan/LPS O-acetylase OafA/YrhL
MALVNKQILKSTSLVKTSWRFPFKTMENIQVIDIMRCLAVWLVVAFHSASRGIPLQNNFLHLIWHRGVNGLYGVYMFFVISGFLITRLIASNPNGLFHPDFREFYSRRIGRILPLLTLICFIGLIFIFYIPITAFSREGVFTIPFSPFNPYFWISIGTFWFNWYTAAFMRQPGGFWAVLWSLSVEEQFYFFFPFVLKCIRNELNLKIFLLVFIILGPVSQYIGYCFYRRNYCIEHNSFTGFGLIATGSLLYLISERYRTYFLQHKKLCVYVCLFGFLMTCKIYFHQSYITDYFGNTFYPMFFGIFLSIFLLGALFLDFFKSKRWWAIALNGRVSYGIYLFHVIVICTVVSFFHSARVP